MCVAHIVAWRKCISFQTATHRELVYVQRSRGVFRTLNASTGVVSTQGSTVVNCWGVSERERPYNLALRSIRCKLVANHSPLSATNRWPPPGFLKVAQQFSQPSKVDGHLAANFSIHNSLAWFMLKHNSKVGGQLVCTPELLVSLR